MKSIYNSNYLIIIKMPYNNAYYCNSPCNIYILNSIFFHLFLFLTLHEVSLLRKTKSKKRRGCRPRFPEQQPQIAT